MSHKNGSTSFSIVTPLLESVPLSTSVSHRVLLKLENVQPMNSFKVRGMGRICSQRASQGVKGFVTFSGGNAGIALAYVGGQMGIPTTIVLPSFVSQRVILKMKGLGAEVKVVANAMDAENEAVNLGRQNPELSLIHPYNDEQLWEGYSTIVDEIKEQLKDGQVPSCFILSVGGGGLLMGLIKGLQKHGWEKVPIVAVETEGAHSLNKSIKEGRIVENVLSSIAKTLGAPSIAPKVMEMLDTINIISVVQSDASAVEACLRFADDHAFCVEPASGVSLSTVYENKVEQILAQKELALGEGPVIVLVCGGNDSSVKILTDYANQLGVEIL